jgi:hypothetical protein
VARILAKDDHVVIRLAWWEKVLARRGDVRVPLPAVRRVTVETNWWRALRGVHENGFCVPGALSIGTRRHQAGRDFVVWRPGRPAVCVELGSTAAFSLLAVSVPDATAAEAAARMLRGISPQLDTSTPWRLPLPVSGGAQ